MLDATENNEEWKMSEWCMAHPWMTMFTVWWLAILAYGIIGTLLQVIDNITRCKLKRKLTELEINTLEKDNEDDT